MPLIDGLTFVNQDWEGRQYKGEQARKPAMTFLYNTAGEGA
jgi:hypothetical protein